MNDVNLIGRLTRDPAVRYTNDGLAMASFTLAIDRLSSKDETDYPRITVFGKQAELCEQYIHKGSQVGIHGRITTGSYINKDGQKVYTTGVTADRVEFLGSKEQTENTNGGFEW